MIAPNCRSGERSEEGSGPCNRQPAFDRTTMTPHEKRHGVWEAVILFD